MLVYILVLDIKSNGLEFMHDKDHAPIYLAHQS